MRVVVAGGHGAVARLTARRLVADGHEVVGIVRNPDHVADLEQDGAVPVVADLERVDADALAAVVQGADAVLFAAGAGPGSGTARKDTVDRGAAVLLADAAERAGVRAYVLVSSMGADGVRDGATPDGVDEVFLAYLRAKLAAEDDVLARDGLDAVVLRPGHLTDSPAGGRVRLARSVDAGDVPRDDVAAVLVALLGAAVDGRAGRRTVLELVAGDEPVDDAVRAAVGSDRG
ncbi:SDR family oxidoreductase [Aquipuribacter sp. SD81]|uniref:SDR family oxidoreductase n=1 Tax=Aquipuribacter sp. SD81 TaxID=3127703 RepID=UPI00301AC85E